MDNAMKGDMGVGSWDLPVCPTSGDCYHTSNGCAHGSVRCASCAFNPSQMGGFGDPHLGPSCWKAVRAYSRGLRSLYIDAAERLLAGPLQPCRLQVWYIQHFHYTIDCFDLNCSEPIVMCARRGSWMLGRNRSNRSLRPIRPIRLLATHRNVAGRVRTAWIFGRTRSPSFGGPSNSISWHLSAASRAETTTPRR